MDLKLLKIRTFDKVLKKMQIWNFQDIWEFELMPDIKEYEIMRFTGLLDKSGKEIYEGDVVEFLYKNPESQEKLAPVSCEVVWSDEGAWALKWPDGYINGARLQPKKYTVIGNIHENPKLLN